MRTRKTLYTSLAAAAVVAVLAIPAFAQNAKTTDADTDNTWTCPRFEEMQKLGYGPGSGMGYGMRNGGPGYGMGYGMMSGGPRFSHHRGYGHGFGLGFMGGGRWNTDKDLSVEQVKDILEGKIAMHGNDNLKVGKVEAKDDNTAIAEIVTKDGSLVQRLEVNRDTGWMRPTK